MIWSDQLKFVRFVLFLGIYTIFNDWGYFVTFIFAASLKCISLMAICSNDVKGHCKVELAWRSGSVMDYHKTALG